MLRRITLALALASALTGCISSPPQGPLVEYRDGIAPDTRPVKCPATYVLTSDPPGPAPLAEHHIAQGERIGFRREEDGSVVAVAPGYTLALSPGAYRWEAVPGSIPSWRERFATAAEDTAGATGRVVLLTAGVCAFFAMSLAFLVLWYGLEKADRAR